MYLFGSRRHHAHSPLDIVVLCSWLPSHIWGCCVLPSTTLLWWWCGLSLCSGGCLCCIYRQWGFCSNVTNVINEKNDWTFSGSGHNGPLLVSSVTVLTLSIVPSTLQLSPFSFKLCAKLVIEVVGNVGAGFELQLHGTWCRSFNWLGTIANKLPKWFVSTFLVDN